MNSLSDWASKIAETVAQTMSRRFCHPTATYRL